MTVILTVVALIATLFLVGTPTASGAAPGRRFSVTPLDMSSRESTPKSPSSRLAESDPTLLQGGSGTVAIVVKLDYDSLATYAGTVKGLAATSPASTGSSLDTSSSAGRAYTSYIEGREADFEARLRTVSPSARIGRKLRTVYGGVGLIVPAADVAEIAQLPGVVAVQRDARRQLLTDSSPEFIGAHTLYDHLGSTDRNAGQCVIVGILDSGSWPEHPSYIDTEGLPAPPARADGAPRVCDFGDNPLTAPTDVFACNNKLIGGQPFLDTYNAFGFPENYPDSARDGNGHGTHTSSTSAGSYVAEAPIFGIDRGPIHGIAPGAYLSVYKVCGTEGCFGTDSAAAVGASIEDGVRVINFSISGGESPLTDVVELAFLDAYQAGVFVAASAGNSGPGAATAAHLSPWVTTVAASTQSRAFQSTLTLTEGADTLDLVGASITEGVDVPTPVVSAAAPPYSNPLCLDAAPPGTFTGKIVVCERGPGRAQKGFNVLQGGAVGMILYNPTTQETLTDNHFLPTVHLEGPQGAQLLAFLAANPTTVATFTDGEKGTAQGDVITSVSSRGPGGVAIKPDITAPGAQILAGNTPTPDEVAGGPPGEYFQAIAGTSMSSPHIAGSAALVAALHPDWGPGQIKSALMTTASTDVVKEDTVTPADPFDHGSGRVDLTKAGDPGLTFSESAARMFVFTADPRLSVDINQPSVNAPVMPGSITTQRVARNTTDGPLTFTATTSAPPGSRIGVVPSSFTVRAGGSVNLSITIDGGRLEPGQYFGQIALHETSGDRELHLPVAFNRQQGSVAMSQICNPTTVAFRAISLCKVTIRNNSFSNTSVRSTTKLDNALGLVDQTGAYKTERRTVQLPLSNLEGKTPATPTVAPGETPGPGYLDLEEFDIPPEPLGDEDFLTLDTDPYLYGGDTFSTLGISSNGYLVAGGGTSEDNTFEPQALPDPARPNNVLAAFWSDLDGSGTEGLRAAILSDSVTGDAWVLIQWDVYLFGTTTPVAAQVWVGLNGTEDVSYAYPGPQPDPGPAGLTVGAENIDGSSGAQVSLPQALSGESLRVATDGGAKGEAAIYRLYVRGVVPGVGVVTTAMNSPAVPGTTVKRGVITIRRP
ncbi:MAG: S8 family serine peptidase [Acidimicrobiales bacterium]